MMSNFLICFCTFELFYLILEKDNFIENVQVMLTIKWAILDLPKWQFLTNNTCYFYFLNIKILHSTSFSSKNYFLLREINYK